MANKRQLTKMGQTARKASTGEATSKKANSVMNKTDKIATGAIKKGQYVLATGSKSLDSKNNKVRGNSKVGKQADAIIQGRVKQVKKEKASYDKPEASGPKSGFLSKAKKK
jgi:hypothetical protein